MIARLPAGFLILVALLAAPASSLAQGAADLFDGRVLQEIRIEVDPADWQSLRDNIWSNDYYPCTLRWRGLVARNIGMRSRGGSSRSSIKPSLQFDFGQFVEGMRFLGLKGAVLRNHGHDPTMMRERLAMPLFERLGIPAPRESYARVFVNGEYAGLYTLVELVDKTFLQRVFGENDGYLYTCDYGYGDPEYRFEYRGPDPGLYSPKPFKPETHEKDPDAGPIEAFLRVVNFASDQEFPSAVSGFIDLQLFATYLAVENFTGEGDGFLGHGGINNFSVYRFEGKNLSQLIPWDRGYAFSDPPDISIWHQISDVPPERQNVLARRALAIPEIRRTYIEALWRCAEIAGGAKGWLAQELERQYDLIHTAALEDENKLQMRDDGVPIPCPNEVFEAAVDQLRQFIRNRSAFVVESVVAVMDRSSSRDFPSETCSLSSFVAPDHTGPTTTGFVQASLESDGFGGEAVIGYRQDGVLISEASLSAAGTLSRGRMLAQSGGGIRTGLAIVNPNSRSAVVAYSFTDSQGLKAGNGSVSIPPRSQAAAFLDGPPWNGPSVFLGTFSFETSLPVAAAVLRGLTNERSEFLLTTLPITNLDDVPADRAVIPHLAHGAGWDTQIVLVNPTDGPLTGELLFYDQGSSGPVSPLPLAINGVVGNRISYSIPPGGAQLMQTTGSADSVKQGSAQVNPLPGQAAPFSFAVLSLRVGNTTVSAAGVASQKGTALRIPAESSGDFERSEPSSFQTGIAISNPSSTPASVRLELVAADGSQILGVQNLAIPPNGQRSCFMNQLEDFPQMPTSFRGILRLTTSSPSGVAVAALRGRINERHDFLISNTPALREITAGSTQLFFPHFAAGGGYSTRFTIMKRTPGNSAIGSGTLRFFDATGAPLNIALF